ncbi:DUF1631 domain-containing protein [Aestuariicella sp. G3-2]|uniref:DUF1631 domain-containing protein n=1 Tax=Pseudomaricurvus albidus TaxID=2842452 RepID=UPI001C0C1B0D|nr:DUF1631 domain-containing protein [Aestuariicella albida]MBU3069458.1 DUF1631 domain-containing protein [Aestuariicella albida]
MSKLHPPETTAGGLTDSVIIDYLKACQTILVEHAGDCFAQFMKALDNHFLEHSGRAKTNKEKSEFLEQQDLLHKALPQIERYFLGYLGEGFIKFKRHELATSTGEEKYQKDMLSLVDNEDLEETIAITSITHRAENHYAESLWALNQRLAVLNKGEKVDDRSNPAGPVQYCESLRKSLQRTALSTKSKIIIYKLFDREVMVQLAEPLQEINQYLVGKGILPNLRHRPVTSDSGKAAPPADAVYDSWDNLQAGGEVELPGSQSAASGFMESPDASLPSDQYQDSLVDAIRTLQNHIGGFAPQAGGAQSGGGGAPTSIQSLVAQPSSGVSQGGAAAPGGRPGMVYSNQQLVGALQALQTQALTVTGQQLMEAQPGTLQPLPVANVSQQLAQQLIEEEGDEDSVDPGDMHTIDLVGMLFEYMLSDDNLPDSVKALLSYLHTPFLKIAFIDKSFFEQTEHPARLLLNNMAEAGVKWVSNDGSSQFDIYDKIKSIVSRVLEEFKNDVRLFAELLLEFSGYTKKISRRQELMERRAMEKVQGEEKLREVKIRVNEEVRSRTDGRELPSAVLLMLLQPWSDYLAFILLRYGETSDSWLRATQVIDDVLWSIEPKENAEDKSRQKEMHTSLLNNLEVGFETIGYDQAKGKKLLEALYSLQKMALQSKQIDPAPEPMRSKLEAMAAKKAGQSDAAEDQPNAEELRMVENLKMIEFGTWFEFDGGKRLKVAWYNSKTLHYMLVDQMGKKVAMKSGLELARDMLAHKAKVIAGSSKPFFERALENIFQSLNAKAEGLKPKGKS